MSLFTPARFPCPVTRDAVAAAWQARGYSCGLFVDPPGRAWRDFTHGVDEVLAVIEGRLMVTVSDERFEAAPGDELFIPAGALHSVENVADTTTRWLYGYARPRA